MKVAFKFKNLCGTVYRKGNVIFNPRDDTLFSPVGNRITQFDLTRNTSRTLPFENLTNVSKIAISPDGTIMISIDEDGRALVASLSQFAVLSYFNFKQPVSDAKYSPCGKFLAVTNGRRVQTWLSPSHSKAFSSFVLHQTFPGHYDDVISIDWSSDSRYIVSTSKDMTACVYSVEQVPGFTKATLTGHRASVLGGFFQKDSLTIYTVGEDCSIYVWETRLGEEESAPVPDAKLDRDEENDSIDSSSKRVARPMKRIRFSWRQISRHLFLQKSTRVVSVTYHRERDLLVLGFANGVFSLYEMPELTLIHSLSISHEKLTSVAINGSGDWLALGCSKLGQLVVWEWGSESFILKQQGHFYGMTSLAFSPDAQHVATGGEDGKVKIWDLSTGFCFVTFHEHTGGVTGVEYTQTGQVICSASIDGTVRAFDLIRYRNFRIMTSPKPVQFSCLAVESSGDVICAGSQDTFEIFVWSMRTGRLLEVLSGHEGPISALAFSSSQALLASSSWDKTVRLWDVFERKGAVESLHQTSEVINVSFSPDGKELAVSTMDGVVGFWDVGNAIQVGSVEGRRDLGSGRLETDRVTAERSTANKFFTSLCYSADGSCILAGGRSKFVCIYDVKEQILLKKFQISQNRSLDGMKQFLRSSNMTEAGPLDLIDDNESDVEDIRLPGVLAGDHSSRRHRPEIRTKSVRFAPTGQAWAAVSTEGLLVYSLDTSLVFDPFDLGVDVTSESITTAIRKQEYNTSVLLSLRLNEDSLIKRALEAVPRDHISIVSRFLPVACLERLLTFVASQLEASPHLEFYVTWSTQLLSEHGKFLKGRGSAMGSVFRALQKGLSRHVTDLATLCDQNSFALQYLISLRGQKSENVVDRDQESEEMIIAN